MFDQWAGQQYAKYEAQGGGGVKDGGVVFVADKVLEILVDDRALNVDQYKGHDAQHEQNQPVSNAKYAFEIFNDVIDLVFRRLDTLFGRKKAEEQ